MYVHTHVYVHMYIHIHMSRWAAKLVRVRITLPGWRRKMYVRAVTCSWTKMSTFIFKTMGKDEQKLRLLNVAAYRFICSAVEQCWEKLHGTRAGKAQLPPPQKEKQNNKA